MKSVIIAFVAFVLGAATASWALERVVQDNATITRNVLQDERTLIDCNVVRVEGELLYKRQVQMMRGDIEP